MRSHDTPHRSRSPYDGDAADLTDEFWGAERPRRVASDPMLEMSRGRHPVRTHDIPVTAWSHHGSDPAKVRAGMFVLGMLLLIPIVVSIRPDRSPSIGETAVVEAAGPAIVVPTSVSDTDPVAVADPLRSDQFESDPLGAEGGAAPESTTAPPTPPAMTESPTSSGDAISDADPDGAEPATAAGRRTTATVPSNIAVGADVAAPARRVVPACPQTYTAGAGDSWYRIAEEAGIGVDDLLDENNATLLAVIHPGDTICLPAGAAVPSPPPTTTSPPSTTTPTTTPTTTTPPATTIPSANLSPTEVQDLIRRTWPADQVDKALAIAWRESNYIATADNGWCCVGVFQIYWTVHQGWLGQFDIHQRDDLKDARKNIAAAYHMWQQQGWGPWGG